MWNVFKGTHLRIPRCQDETNHLRDFLVHSSPDYRKITEFYKTTMPKRFEFHKVAVTGLEPASSEEGWFTVSWANQLLNTAKKWGNYPHINVLTQERSPNKNNRKSTIKPKPKTFELNLRFLLQNLPLLSYQCSMLLCNNHNTRFTLVSN